jgi:hypothetical protein
MPWLMIGEEKSAELNGGSARSSRLELGHKVVTVG